MRNGFSFAMRIDAHQHFWKYNRSRDSWITEEMSVLKRDFLPGDLDKELKANGIDATIAVQTGQSEDETLFLLELAQRNPGIAGVVGWIDLCSPHAEQRMRYFSRFEKLRGFRHLAQSEPDDRFLIREHFVRGVAQLGQLGFTYDVLIYPKHLSAALELVTRLPQQKFVIDHLAKPLIKSRTIVEWAAHMRNIATNPNVYCKLSGLVTEADWHAWKKEDFRPYLEVAFDAFGPHRLLFGSDWPVCLLAASYQQVLQIIEEYVQAYPADVREKIFGGNAAQFYGLKTARHGSAT